MTSTRLRTAFVRRARSACPSRSVPRAVAAVSPEKIDDADEESGRTEERGEGVVDEPDERAARAGRGKGR